MRSSRGRAWPDRGTQKEVIRVGRNYQLELRRRVHADWVQPLHVFETLSIISRHGIPIQKDNNHLRAVCSRGTLRKWVFIRNYRCSNIVANSKLSTRSQLTEISYNTLITLVQKALNVKKNHYKWFLMSSTQSVSPSFNVPTRPMNIGTIIINEAKTEIKWNYQKQKWIVCRL